MANVGKVKDAVRGEAVEFQNAKEEVPVNVGGEISDVGGGIDRGATGVDGDFFGIFWLKGFERAGGGVVEF